MTKLPSSNWSRPEDQSIDNSIILLSLPKSSFNWDLFCENSTAPSSYAVVGCAHVLEHLSWEWGEGSQPPALYIPSYIVASFPLTLSYQHGLSCAHVLYRYCVSSYKELVIVETVICMWSACGGVSGVKRGYLTPDCPEDPAQWDP